MATKVCTTVSEMIEDLCANGGAWSTVEPVKHMAGVAAPSNTSCNFMISKSAPGEVVQLIKEGSNNTTRHWDCAGVLWLGTQVLINFMTPSIKLFTWYSIQMCHLKDIVSQVTATLYASDWLMIIDRLPLQNSRGQIVMHMSMKCPTIFHHPMCGACEYSIHMNAHQFHVTCIPYGISARLRRMCWGKGSSFTKDEMNVI